MYRISYYTGNKLETIYNSALNNNEIESALFHPAVNSVGSLTLKILPSHSAYSSFEILKGIITLYRFDKIIFKGRIYNISIDDYNIKTVEIEGILGILNDTIVKPYKYNSSNNIDGSVSTNKFGNWLYQISNNHNKQTTGSTNFFTYDISDDLKNLSFTCSSSRYSTTWEEISERFIKGLGGYLWIEYGTNIATTENDILHFESELSAPSSQEIRYAVNLISIKRKYSADDFATAILPLGAKYKDETGTEHRTSIYSVNEDNNEFLIDVEAVEKYGRINKVVEFDGVSSPAELLELSKKKLAAYLYLSGELTISAVDLSLQNNSENYFDIGQKIRLISEPHNVDTTVMLTEAEIELTKPQDGTYSLGVTKKSQAKELISKFFKTQSGGV